MIRTTSLHVLALSVQSEDKIQIGGLWLARKRYYRGGWMASGQFSAWLFFQARAVEVEVQVFSKMVDGEMSMSVWRCLDDPLESESGLIHPYGSDSEIWISEKCVRWYWSQEHPNVIPVCKCKAKAILSYMLLLILINHKHDASLPSPVPRTPILTFPYPPPLFPLLSSPMTLPPPSSSTNTLKEYQKVPSTS